MPARPWSRLCRDRKAATAIEYALLGSLSSILAIAAFNGFGDGLAMMYAELTEALVGAMGG